LLPPQEFAALPRGRQKLGGTEFNLRGLIQLDHHAERPDHPGPFHPLATVRVGQRCRARQFLQATESDPRIHGSTVARWIVRYADGSAREWPVIYGEHVREICWRTAEEPLEANQATMVWRGRSPILDVPGSDGFRLFKAT
jgi:hypothetical protein